MERQWNANGTRMEREWSANGARMERLARDMNKESAFECDIEMV